MAVGVAPATDRDQAPRAAEWPDASPHAPSAYSPADRADQCDPRASCLPPTAIADGENVITQAVA